MNKFLESFSKEQLVGLVEAFAKNISAIDGVWFQALEKQYGMDAAMAADIDVWGTYAYYECQRYKKMFNMPAEAGLDGLEFLLKLHFNSIMNSIEFSRPDDKTLIFRTIDCRVQTARSRKGMPLHPCKPAGFAEYSGFAKAADARIVCEAISCFPDVTDNSCACAWKFTLPE